MRLEPVARPQPPEDAARHLGALLVVAEEHHAPIGGHAARRRLRHVMQHRAHPQRLPARHLVGQRLRQQGRDGRRPARPEHGGGIALERDRRLEHRERVPGDVAVVVAVLLHAAHRVELGQDDRGQPELARELQARRRRPGAARMRLSSPKTRSAATSREPRRRHPGPPRSAAASASRPSSQAEAHEAQRPQGVGVERAGRGQAQPPGREVGDPAERIDRRAAGERLGDRVDREVPQREVCVERPAAQRVEVGLPGVVARHHAPGPELVRERERARPGRSGERLRPPRASASTTMSIVAGRRPTAGARPGPRRRRAMPAAGQASRAASSSGPAHASTGTPSR